MRCRKCRASLFDYLDETLPPEVMEEVRCHLRECRRCADDFGQEREIAHAFRSSVEGLGELPGFRFPPPAGAGDASGPRRRRPGHPAAARRFLAAAALFVFALAVVVQVKVSPGPDSLPAAGGKAAPPAWRPAAAAPSSAGDDGRVGIVSLEDSLGSLYETHYVAREGGVTTHIVVEISNFRELPTN